MVDTRREQINALTHAIDIIRNAGYALPMDEYLTKQVLHHVVRTLQTTLDNLMRETFV